MALKSHILCHIVKRFVNINSTRYIRLSSTLQQETEISENEWKKVLHAGMRIYPNFITPEEEDSLFGEIEPYLKRLRYEFSHWDDAIHGYRETERYQWNENNRKILDRVREKAFSKNAKHLILVHILDLAAEGWIKPHVDSVRFCGDVIAGLSLLSDSVMRLTRVGLEDTQRESFLLPRRSLYIMSDVARYDYKHEILKDEQSYYEGKRIPRSRRISVICRCEPTRKSD